MKIRSWMLLAAIVAGLPACRMAGHLGHHAPCDCDKVCRTYAEPSTEQVPCWEVERQEICVPGVRFPWQSCNEPGHRAAVVRVNVLKAGEQERPTCNYEWRIEPATGQPCPVPEPSEDEIPPTPSAPPAEK